MAFRPPGQVFLFFAPKERDRPRQTQRTRSDASMPPLAGAIEPISGLAAGQRCTSTEAGNKAYRHKDLRKQSPIRGQAYDGKEMTVDSRPKVARDPTDGPYCVAQHCFV